MVLLTRIFWNLESRETTIYSHTPPPARTYVWNHSPKSSCSAYFELSLSFSLFIFSLVVLPKITSMLPANRFSRKQRKKRGSSRLKLPRLGVIKQWSTSSFQNALLYAFKPILDPIFWRVYWWWMEKKLRNSQGSLWSSVWDHLCAGGWSRAATRPPLPRPPHFLRKKFPPFGLHFTAPIRLPLVWSSG